MRLIHPTSRSTTHRRGSSTNPRLTSGRLATVSVMPWAAAFFQIASQGQLRRRAWMLFPRAVSRQLLGGLSLALHSLNDRTARVEPSHLLHPLYLRLRLDTITAEPLERDLVCRTCGAPLHGRRSMRYCDDACRNVFHDQRRAIQGNAGEPAARGAK